MELKKNKTRFIKQHHNQGDIYGDVVLLCASNNHSRYFNKGMKLVKIVLEVKGGGRWAELMNGIKHYNTSVLSGWMRSLHTNQVQGRSR